MAGILIIYIIISVIEIHSSSKPGIDVKQLGKETISEKTDHAKIFRLSINTATYNELINHPYITDEQAKKIIRYRQIRPIQSYTQLEYLDIFSKTELEKIAPYINYR